MKSHIFAVHGRILVFIPTRVDNDMYIQKNIKENGTYYYQHLVVYVDGCLIVSHDLEKVMIATGDWFKIEDNKYGLQT